MQTVEGRERMCRLGFTTEVIGNEREDDYEEIKAKTARGSQLGCRGAGELWMGAAQGWMEEKWCMAAVHGIAWWWSVACNERRERYPSPVAAHSEGKSRMLCCQGRLQWVVPHAGAVPSQDLIQAHSSFTSLCFPSTKTAHHNPTELCRKAE